MLGEVRCARRAAIVALLVVAQAVWAAAPAAAALRRGAPDDLHADRREQPEDRYALAGGCYALSSLDGSSASEDAFVVRSGEGFAATGPELDAAEPFHLQATDLGSYLLFGTASDFLTADGSSVVGAAGASPAADWEVTELAPGAFSLSLPATQQTLAAGPDGRLVLQSGGSEGAGFAFHPAEGCAAFPEVEVNLSGEPASGSTPYGEVTGYLDAHLHLTAYEFLGGRVHCGRPWHRYGVTYALRDCPDHTLADGAGAVIENFLSAGSPVGSHDPVGWPTFHDWPAPGSLTHEQTYYRWVERAWRGGLRILVNLFVENRVLCEVYPLKQNPCDEMASVRLQARRIRELERYIDAQSGGPGEGWFRIVDDPFEARRVANEGRLAVVLGVELSEPFGCRSFLGRPQCSAADIDAQLDELEALGVRQLVVIHKFDNALGGVAGDGGTKGTVINLGNFLGTGHFWHFETCQGDVPGVHDNEQSAVPVVPNEHGELFGAILSAFAPPGALPVYPPPPHCNTFGLTPLGVHAVEAMADRGMIVDVDHMSVRARQQALDVLEARQYSGVISSHSWATPDAYERIYDLGGVTAPYAGGSESFVETWQQRRQAFQEPYAPGIGFGADANGLGAQGDARGPGAPDPVRYPFEGLGGVVVDRQVSGKRVYDVNVDGVAHYGLYPDWIADLRQIAGDEIVEDLARGAEAYLQMWERAVGVDGPGCRSRDDLASLSPGMSPEEVLRQVGQPVGRRGSAFEYCLAAGGERTVRFDLSGALAAQPSEPSGPGQPAPGGPDDPAAGGAGRAGEGLPPTGGNGDLLALLGAALLSIALIVRRAG